MSQGLNKVILIGALAEEPKLKTTANGKKRLVLRLHTTQRYRDAAGLERESHSWHTVAVWGRRAEVLAERLRRGRRVAIEGRLHGYKTDSDPPRWRDEIVALDVVLLDGPSSSAAPAAAGQGRDAA